MPEVTLYPVYGSRIRALREDHGLTLAELGALAGLSKSYLSRIEHGKIPSSRAARNIALSLGVPVELLRTPPTTDPEPTL